MKLSSIILTRNEEHNVVACIKALRFCDEIIIVDDHSTDKTITLAKKNGAVVYEHALNEDFAQQRNFALQKTTGDWVFFIDADERVTSELRKEIIQKLTENNNVDGYLFKRIDYLWGEKLAHGEISTLRLLRLAKKNSGIWKGKVHETMRISGRTETLANPILHYPHPTISEFLITINVYSSLRAEELYAQGVHANAYAIIAYPLGKFLQNYIMRLGFLDGIAGLLLAIIMSLHSFLVRGNLWFLWQKK